MATRTQGQEGAQISSKWVGSRLPVGTRTAEPTSAEDYEFLFFDPVRPEEVGQSGWVSYGERGQVLVSGSVTERVAEAVVRFVHAPAAESMLLAKELNQLREKVKALEDHVAHLASATPPVQERVILLRSITQEDAKSEIVRLFQTSDVLDYGEIAEKLQIDLPLVVDICNELEREGIIGEPH